MARRSSLKRISDINMTPLIDMAFTLLITFIITFPLIEEAIPVKLPKADAQKVESTKSRTVSVNDQGLVYLDNQQVSIDQLKVRMNAIAKSAPETAIMIRADEQIRYAQLVKVLKVLYDAKISRMSLVTEAESK